MRIDFSKGNRRTESLISTFIKVFIIGWAIYYTLFLFVDHFYVDADISLIFFNHDNFQNGDSDRFRDFFEVNRAAAIGDCYLTGECANYPPLVLAIAKFFSVFTPSILTDATTWDTRDTRSGTILFFVVFTLFVAGFAYGVYRHLRKNLSEGKQDRSLPWILTAMMCYSYTILFGWERGNYIFLALISFMVFVFTYRDHEIISAIALAVCACIKIYPVILFLLYLVDRRYKGFLIGIVTGVVGLFLPMLALNGSIVDQFLGLLKGVLNFTNSSQATKGEVGFNHVEQHSNSFSNIFRMIAVALFGKEPLVGGAAIVTKVLSVISTVLLGAVTAISVFSLFFVRERWKSFFIVTALLCLIPSNTYDYMLTFFLPILVIILCEADLRNRKYVFLLTALACVPKSYFYFGNYFEDVSVQCAINPILMSVMLVMIFFDSAIPAVKKFIGEKQKKGAEVLAS